jgi:hypothetical protein
MFLKMIFFCMGSQINFVVDINVGSCFDNHIFSEIKSFIFCKSSGVYE